MDSPFLATLLSTLLISTMSLVGVITLSVSEKALDRVLNYLIAFSAGTILGAAVLDLLPEAVEEAGEAVAFPVAVGGYLCFLLLERTLYWYHGHGHSHDVEEKLVAWRGEQVLSLAYLNIVGDFIHNFVDGMIIAVAFQSSYWLGVTTSVAVAFHELPQEMGDFGILVYAGVEPRKAILVNFGAALSIVAGGVLASLFIPGSLAHSGIFSAFTAGGFLFLSASELIPELEQGYSWKSVAQLCFLVLGIGVIYALGLLLHHP